jgi:tRNA modification GTPase
LTVAIAGPVNAGKSTLLNRLARREAAIVSPYAGTTRDVIEVHLDLDGWPVTLLDTAGIRDGGDAVEMEGVRRARERAAAADLVLWVVDASEPDLAPVIPGRPGDPDPESITPVRDHGVRARPPLPSGLRRAPGNDALTAQPGPAIWLVRNKIDLIKPVLGRNESELQNGDSNEIVVTTIKPLRNMVNKPLKRRNERALHNNESEFNISAATGEGVDRLLSALSSHAERVLAGSEQALVTRERHRHALEDTLAALRRALAPDLAGREDLLAEELRAAAQALGRLTGRVDVEDILDVIFRDFCIGK